jgi:hypothetical protein
VLVAFGLKNIGSRVRFDRGTTALLVVIRKAYFVRLVPFALDYRRENHALGEPPLHFAAPGAKQAIDELDDSRQPLCNRDEARRTPSRFPRRLLNVVMFAAKGFDFRWRHIRISRSIRKKHS